MKPILVTSGEPSGVGPDLCLSLVECNLPIVILGDKVVLEERAKQLGKRIFFTDYQPNKSFEFKANHLQVISIPSNAPVVPGKLDPLNSSYVLTLLTTAISKCLHTEFSALVTAPVHKGVINQAGMAFTGHTEFLAEQCKIQTVVMLLVCPIMKVALVTTHLPLRQVPDAITAKLINDITTTLHVGLKRDFGIQQPKIYMAGLNPHAGEGGYLGREELDVIQPAIVNLRKRGIHIEGPFPADTMFTPNHAKQCDVFVAMYHDQGLSVLKYAGFGEGVNVTLGLPFIRTSVDHGTALDLAGTGLANPGSLVAAVELAGQLAFNREMQ